MAHLRRLLQNVVEFKVFYRFDAAAYAAAASGVTNAAPFGGSILDAAAINALAGAIDPWNYVVAVMVCITLETDEIGVSTSAVNTTATRCPVSPAEAEAGLGLVMTNTTGTHPPHVFAGLHRTQSCHSVAFNYFKP